MKRVLVVEDNADNLRLMGYALCHAGYEVMEAMTGAEGVRLALEQNPLFVITDISLPDMDGLEMTRRIRQSPVNGTVPIIAITSHAMAGDREQILVCGCTGYFEKPIDPITIVGQIHQVLAAAGHPVAEE
jgi:CheY-like chemotaxis protein